MFRFRCLVDNPNDRISAKAAMKHKFFTDHKLSPSVKDMILLPSNVLKLLNVLDDPKFEDGEERKGNDFAIYLIVALVGIINQIPSIFTDALTEIHQEASKYGIVTDIKAHDGHAFIEFQEAGACQSACTGLTGRLFDEKTVVAVFYPSDLWANDFLRH